MSDLSEAVLKRLDAMGIEYESRPCDPSLADTADFCAHYGHALEDSANTILVKSKRGTLPFVACVLLAHTRLDVNQVLRKRLEARKVSFASPDETREITGMELGGVTAFGLPEDLPLMIDAAVMQRETIILGSGERASKLFMAPAALMQLPGAEVIEGLAKAMG